MCERGTAIEADARNAGNRELDDQHIARLAGRVVAGCTLDGAHHAVGEGRGVETGSRLGVLIVPETNRVLCHCESFRFRAKSRPIPLRSEEHTSELQSHSFISYAVFCLKKKKRARCTGSGARLWDTSVATGLGARC